MSSLDENALSLAAEAVASARYLVALSGAGISVESGIPPFRGPDGIWTKQGEPSWTGFDNFLADPEGWWAERLATRDRPGDLRTAIEDAKPNDAHYALAELEEMGILRHIITQNIDNLHIAAGNLNVTEIHGNAKKLRCIACHRRWPAEEFPIDDIPPHCPHCQGLIKSDTVLFGEYIPSDALASSEREAQLCDCMLLVGTSAVVYPAAQLPVIAYGHGATLIEVNPEETPLTHLCSHALRAPAGLALTSLLDRVRQLRG